MDGNRPTHREASTKLFQMSMLTLIHMEGRFPLYHLHRASYRSHPCICNISFYSSLLILAFFFLINISFIFKYEQYKRNIPNTPTYCYYNIIKNSHIFYCLLVIIFFNFNNFCNLLLTIDFSIIIIYAFISFILISILK